MRFVLVAPLVTLIACGAVAPAGVPSDAGHEGTPDAHFAPHPFDAQVQPEAAVADAGTCPPDSVSFQPTWAPPNPHQAKCTRAQIDDYLTECLGALATAATCAPFRSGAGLDCAACIEAPDTAPTRGPLVSHGSYVTPNVAGCIVRSRGDAPEATSCGKAIVALDQCRALACECAPQTELEGWGDHEVCVQRANTGACKSYVAPADCVDALPDAGDAAAACVGGKTFADDYHAIVPLFCGGAPEDGGTDAGASDAAEDG